MSSQRNSTYFNEKEEVPLPEGVTPQQEQAASLLASGMAIREVADQLEIHRPTLWHWRQLETFQAFARKQRMMLWNGL